MKEEYFDKDDLLKQRRESIKNKKKIYKKLAFNKFKKKRHPYAWNGT